MPKTKRAPPSSGPVSARVHAAETLNSADPKIGSPDLDSKRRVTARRKERRLDDRRRGVNIQLIMQNAEVPRLLRYRYGGDVLPDDDAGRDDLFIALQVRAPKGEGEPVLRDYIKRIAPWLTPHETAALLDRVYGKPFKFNATTLGEKFGVHDAERTFLGLTQMRPVDISPEGFEARRAAKKTVKQRERRRALGVPSRAEWLRRNNKSKNEPWRSAGMSKSTWHRRKLHLANQTDSETGVRPSVEAAVETSVTPAAETDGETGVAPSILRLVGVASDVSHEEDNWRTQAASAAEEGSPSGSPRAAARLVEPALNVPVGEEAKEGPADDWARALWEESVAAESQLRAARLRNIT
jgi:hypothetical protein